MAAAVDAFGFDSERHGRHGLGGEAGDIGMRMAVALAVLAPGMGTARADIPKGPPPVVVMPPPPAPPPIAKPAPPLPPTPKVRAVPAGSPGSWVTSEDYPSAALRMELAGRVSFRLFLDTAGKVSYCQILSSSNYDILDTAVCDLMTKRGAFVPAKDAKGRPVADVWTSRFVWQIPETGDANEIQEYSGVYILQINKMGVVVDCAMALRSGAIEKEDAQCPSFNEMPRLVALEMRGYGDTETVEADVEESQALSASARDNLLAYKPGYEVRSALVFRVETDVSGKIVQCVFEQQRGASALIHDACSTNYDRRYSPKKDTAGAAVPTTFWYVERILRKLAP